MAKYNLLEDDDIFDEEDDLTEKVPAEDLQDDKQEIDASEDIDIDIDEDLLNIDSPDAFMDEEDLKEEIDIDNIEEEEPKSQEPLPEPEPEITEFEPEIITEENADEKEETKQPFLTDDFEDEKQSGINYKPIAIIGTIIILLILGYIALDTWVFSDSTESTENIESAAEPAKTQEQIQQEQEAQRKQAFLSKVAAKTSSDISAINNAIQNAQSSAKLSSVLLYGNSFMFEVFGSDRNDLARVNMNLKDNMSGNNFEVISSQTRPGSNGGVFGLFKGTLSAEGGATKSVKTNFNSINDIESWIKNTSASNSLKVNSLTNKYLEEENNFRKFEVQTTLSGSIDACNTFLKKLSSDGGQIQIHKLNLNAVDQKSFQEKKYQLKMILEIYV